MFTYQSALKNGMSRYDLIKLVVSGQVERVARGTYQSIDMAVSLEASFCEATLQLGKPSCVCLISALDYYSLTELVPSQIWMMVNANKRTIKTHIKLFRTRQPHWQIGIIKENGFWITSLERTLIDCLTHKKLVARQTAIEAIRLALTEKTTTLHALITMAEKLKVIHLVYPTLETFT